MNRVVFFTLFLFGCAQRRAPVCTIEASEDFHRRSLEAACAMTDLPADRREEDCLPDGGIKYCPYAFIWMNGVCRAICFSPKECGPGEVCQNVMRGRDGGVRSSVCLPQD